MKEQNNTKKVQKQNTGRIKGITLIALVVTIVVLLILAGVTITVVFGDNGILQLAKEAADKTNEAVKNDKEEIEELGDLIKDSVAGIKSPLKSKEEDEKVTFETNYGTIDVIWLDTNNKVKAVPNEPILSAKNDDGQEESMTKVKWTEKQTVEDKSAKWEEETESEEKTWSNAEWYNYRKAEGTDDTKMSRWANAITANGSYFVWIPRYAYRITYYESEENIEEQEPTGYYDGWGMYDKAGNLKYKLDEGIETVAYNGNKYIVHPAFMDNRENNFDNGGWDKDLAGFWFAKYEMSEDSEKIDDDSNELKSVPGVPSLREITIGAMYQASRNAKYGYVGMKEIINSGGTEYTHTSYMNSHLVKNSEWGAVAFLTQSAYGRNGHEIDINNSSSYITGNGGGAVGGTASPASKTTNAYNTEIGAHASTTGNIYGIYDMSGGSWEYVASYDKKGDSSKLTDLNMGLYLTKETKSNIPSTEDGSGYEYISTKYATAYENGTTNYNDNTTIYKVSRTGDAVKEVITGSTGWFDDYSVICWSNGPFLVRGGNYMEKVHAGKFCSNCSNGGIHSSDGFRTVLCP